MTERLFKLKEAGTTVRVELLGGLTTFLTMAYIIFVNAGILSTDFAGNPTGLSFEAAMLATCLASAVATILMGLLANYPIAQAPGMGENFFFVTVVMALSASGVTDAWRVALGIVFISGVIFLLLSLFPFRKAIIEAVSPSLKNGIAVGIGLLIAYLGLYMSNTGVIIIQNNIPKLNPNIFNFREPDLIIFFLGLFVTAALHARKVKGSILIGIIFTAVVSLIWGKTKFEGVFGLPKDHAFLKMDVARTCSMVQSEFMGMVDHFTESVFGISIVKNIHVATNCISFIIVFIFMDLFDTMGTLIGVGEQGGFMKDNKLPRSSKALVSDAAGTVVGSMTGTSTVTSFIESCVGVEYGARTGLANLVTGILFLLALFLTPIASMIGSYPPITAPALVIVGAMMVNNVRKIEWSDYSEAIPAFLAIIGIPLTLTIHNGIALGFMAYPVVKLLSGKGREVHWLMYVIGLILIVRYVFVRV